MISFNCACGESLAAADEHAGLRVQCPKCNSQLVVPAAESEFEYADDPAPPPPKKKGPVLVEDDEPPSRKMATPLPPPKKKPVLVEDDEDEPAPGKKKAKLVDDEESKPRKKKKKRNYGDDDEPEHVKALMAKANAELDEEEARHRREGGGIHFTPGIIAGVIAFLVGSLGMLLFMCLFPNFYIICLCGALALGGLIRAILSFLGQGVD